MKNVVPILIFLTGLLIRSICFAVNPGIDSSGVIVNCLFTNLENYKDVSIVSALKNSENKITLKIASPEARFNIFNPTDSIRFYAIYGEVFNENKINESYFSDPHFWLESDISWNILSLPDQDFFKIEQINSYYDIKGFTPSVMALYKYKEEIIFNNGHSSFTILYHYNNFYNNLFNYFPANISYITNTNIKIYPNPSYGKAAIDIKNDFYGDYTVSVISGKGELMYNKIFTKKEEHIQLTLNLENINKGIYYVLLNFNGRSFSKNISII